jgi:hypothetical protein
MNFLEASKRFEKFKRSTWSKFADDIYWYWCKTSGTLLNSSGNEINLTNCNIFAEDWEEWQKPIETYTFLEACRKFRKIKRRYWDSPIVINENGTIDNVFDGALMHDDLMAKDWIECKEE